MIIRVELIYDADCPAAEDARQNLRETLRRLNLPLHWSEWERSSPATPESLRAFGSPTILVNGRDVAGSEAAGAASCRIYQPRPGRFAAVPPVEMIAAALNEAGAAERVTSYCGAAPAKWLGVMAIPAALAAMLPVLGCPLCWPAYAGLLASLGAGFLASTRYLLPLTIALLTVALAALGIQARRTARYAPLVLGALSAVAIMTGKFAFASAAFTYSGAALLLFASALSFLRREPGASVAGDWAAAKPCGEPSRRPAPDA